jgi:hypothetical protein
MRIARAAGTATPEKRKFSYADHTFSGYFSSHLQSQARVAPESARFRLSRFNNSETEGFPRAGLYLASRSRRLAQ